MGSVERVARFFEKNKPVRSSLPSSYLPQPDDVEGMANYVVFMTSIDHRTGPFFVDLVGKEERKGAELLWKLGELKWKVDKQFFNPRRMSKVSSEEVKRWLTTSKGVVAREPELRSLLLRDAARWLNRLCGGRALRMVERAQGSCSRLVELLRPFKAFNDPVAKKAYLLAKLLIKSKIMRPSSIEELCLPVDNHVTRVTLRLGLVEAPKRNEYSSKLELDIALRLLVREVWRRVVREAEVDPIAMDDLLWLVGRELCKRSEALCSARAEAEVGLIDKVAPWAWGRCPLEEVCLGYRRTQRRRLKEPIVKTWWY
ncbi:MAG: N-glycosylase/DNA lyase [Candidatus Nezhaarchaeota archaeon]|nr:N-glycosylase/DNA lyase [Candidatus Nezhaarchaeota archaeon]